MRTSLDSQIDARTESIGLDITHINPADAQDQDESARTETLGLKIDVGRLSSND